MGLAVWRHGRGRTHSGGEPRRRTPLRASATMTHGGVLLLATAAAVATTAVAAPPPLALFSAGVSPPGTNVTEYRIPVLVALDHGENLLAFAEARLPCVRSCGKAGVGGSWGDSSPKHIAYRRSGDGGHSWTPIKFVSVLSPLEPPLAPPTPPPILTHSWWCRTTRTQIVKSDGTNDNLNLGNAVVDERAGAVILQWGGCVHCSCSGHTPKPKAGSCPDSHPMGNVKQIRSTDKVWRLWGLFAARRGGRGGG
jgi:hypothetical protein